MALISYPRFPSIIIDDSQPFHTKVIQLMDTISQHAVGQAMLSEIQRSGKQIGIAPLRCADNGNKCVAHNAKRFFRLRQAFGGLSANDAILVSLKDELEYTLSEAEKTGHTRMFICKQLVQGLTPATVRTINNLVHIQSNLTNKNIKDDAWTMAQLLEKIIKGNIGYRDIPSAKDGYNLADNLVRILKPWLRPGEGSNCGIYFDPDKQLSCAGDRGMAWRPPGIGLAHELCHAWRNVTGKRMFDDAQACGLDDDEVMTTGIPPYNAEPFSENMFRSVWVLTNWERWRHWINELPMRDSYR